MGLFDEKRLSTATQVLHMVEDTPEIVKQSVLNSVSTGSDISTDILNTINNSLGTKVGRYHRYARTKYTNGLPEGTIGYETIPTEKIQVALDTDRPPAAGKANGVAVVILGEFNTDKACFDFLSRTEPTWDETDLTWNPQGDIYPRTFYESQLLSPTRLRCKYSFRAAAQTYYGTQEFDLTEYPFIANERYYVAEYSIYDITTQAKESQSRYWHYQISSNKYPDMSPDQEEDYSQFMPIVPIRVNNENYADESRKDTPLYQTSKKLLKILDIDFIELATGVDENPEIDEIDHGYFVLGVNPRSTKAATNEYLFRFFSDLEGRSQFNKEAFNNWYEPNVKKGQPPINTLTIKDATYDTTLAWNYVDRIITKGSIGKVGTVTKVIDADYGQETINIGSGGGVNSWIRIENPKNTLTITKQIDADYYVTLVIAGLLFSNKIYGPNVDYISTLASVEGEEIIIPLNLAIVQDLPKLTANTLMYDSMLMVFNAFKWTKLKWYQTGFFRFVTIVISIAITVITFGSGGGIMGLIPGIASTGVAGIAIALANSILTNLLISATFQFVAEHLGLEAALALAAIAAFVTAGQAGGFFTDLPFAFDMSNFNAALGGVQAEIAAQQLDIQQEFADMQVSNEEALKELEAVTEQFNQHRLQDPLGTLGLVGMLPNESPDSYISRVTNMANPLELARMAQENYYEMSLMLPR